MNLSCIDDKGGRAIDHLSRRLLRAAPTGVYRSAATAQFGRPMDSLNAGGTHESNGPQESQ